MTVGYIGKAEYCYSNSAAMLLSSIGEHISPEKIEVSAGIGLGAFLIKNTNLIFFSPLAVAPDVGLTKSLQILGFSFEERSFQQEEPPLEELRKVLETSPVLLGPLDMGYLVYQKHQHPPFGADHFILAYDIDGTNIYLHDPYGYPNTYLTFEQLKPAWKAENIGYKLGSYHWWHSPKRILNPSEREIYNQTIEYFKTIYIESDKTAKNSERIINEYAIQIIADKISKNELNQHELSMLTGFSLPITAKRANDYALFFKPFSDELTQIKVTISKLAGHVHTQLMNNNLDEAAESLKKLAEKEYEFKSKILLS